MSKTVFITGASSGIGKATAFQFQQQGWNVVATLRNPSKETSLSQLPNVICLALDVTQPESIRAAVKAGIAEFGSVDVVVNNAGYGLVGPFEDSTPEQVRRQFDTNVFGVMAVVREFLPHFRERQQGLFINISSMGGRLAVPLYSSYHASKWAVEGFTESLQYEIEPFNIRVKLVEPGAIKTDFYDRSSDRSPDTQSSEYDPFSKKALKNMLSMGETGAPPEKVAATIYRAATDGSTKLRYRVGTDAKALLTVRHLIPHRWFRSMVKSIVLK